MNKLEKLQSQREQLLSKLSSVDKEIARIGLEKYETEGTYIEKCKSGSFIMGGVEKPQNFVTPNADGLELRDLFDSLSVGDQIHFKVVRK